MICGDAIVQRFLDAVAGDGANDEIRESIL